MSDVTAQEGEQRKTKKVGAMTEKVAKKLSAAQELIEAEKIEEGLRELNDIMAFKKLTDYERAQVNYFYGYVEYLKENYQGAINFYRKVLQDEKVPEGLVSSARTTIAQLYFQLEDYPRTVSAVDEILKNQTTPRPDLYILKGTAQYQMDQFEKTIESVEEAISLAESRNADRVTQLQKNVTSAAGKYRVKYDRNNIDYISLANEVKKVIDILKKKNFVYSGKIKAPAGDDSENWVEREQLLFKSTDFGDDKDRALQKSDGSWTYFASDVAYHKNKIDRKFDTLINIDRFPIYYLRPLMDLIVMFHTHLKMLKWLL